MNTFFYLKPCGLPQICFAHTFSAAQYAWHFSPRYPATAKLEIAYVSEGELSCTPASGERLKATRHSVICRPSHLPLAVEATRPHTHHTACFLMPYEIKDAESEGALCLPVVFRLPEGSRAPALIDEIIRLHTLGSRGPLSCAGLFLELLEEIDRRVRKPAAQEAAGAIYIKRAKDYIYAHLHEPICQADIAAQLGITPAYLCSIFKASEGMPLIPFINRIKLLQMRALMAGHGLTLAKAAEQYGYTDPNYASRLHKKYFGYNITEATDR